MANAIKPAGEAKQLSPKEIEDMAFAKLKTKIVGALKIEPDKNYFLLVKKGTLTKVELDVFLSLWQRNLKTGVLIFQVDDPEHDCVAMEVKP